MLCCLLLPFSAFAQADSWQSWVSLKETGKQFFNLKNASADGMQVLLVPKQTMSAQPLKKIFVLFPKKSSAYDTELEQILLYFQQKKMDASFLLYFYGKEDEKGMEAMRLAEKEKMDLIFAMGSDSAGFIHKNYRGAGKIPVVTICAKDPVLLDQMQNYETGSNTNIAYTSLDMPTTIQLEYLRTLVPDLRNIVVLYARQNTSAYNAQVKPLAEACAGTSIAVHELVVENRATAKQELREKVSEAYIMLKRRDPELKKSIFWITGSTEVFSDIATIAQNAGKIPVLSLATDVVDEGDASAAMSIGVGFESNAQLAAFYAWQILSGKAKPGEMPVGIVSPPDIAINFRRVKAIGLKIPFSFFERASIIYDYEGKLRRGQK